MYWRPISDSDLTECLEIQPACLGDQIAGRSTALRVWKGLLHEPSFLANVIESERAIAGHRIVACGMGVFVTKSFADHEIKNPRSGLNSRIVAAVASGDSPLLSRAQIAAGNAGAGIDFVNMYGTWREGIMNNDQLSEVHALLGTSFVEHFAGYRFNRVLKEAVGQSSIALALATGTYRIVAEFKKSESALAVATRESVLAAPYSVAAALYRYQTPELHLRPAEQSLLIAALAGKTDAELSEELGLSIEAIKKRWMSIFDRIDEFKPEILSREGADSDGRGPQKRHRVVAYIRNHPEELRPFSWEARKR
jgi:DNA-binding CsgD family transcriptional regulator